MSHWDEWADEAGKTSSHWAYKFGLAHRRAEDFLRRVGDLSRKVDAQAQQIRDLEAELAQARRENAALSEAVEELETQLEELEDGPVVSAVS